MVAPSIDLSYARETINYIQATPFNNMMDWKAQTSKEQRTVVCTSVLTGQTSV